MGQWTDWKAPSVAASVDRGGNPEWLSPDNAKTDDNNYANSSVGKGGVSDWLRLTSFGFDGGGGLPEGATVEGIEVQYKRAANAADVITDSVIYLRDSSGQVGDNKASATKWATSKETKTYPTSGGESDTWNAGLEASDIRASTFGIDLSADNTDEDNIRAAQIYFCQIRIYYTAPAAGRSFGTIMG